MKTLILIDALSLLYRSFYAIRDLSTAEGMPTNAVYGFIRKLRSIRKKYAPSHWCVAFDGGLPKDRLDLLQAYKAHRPPMPHALREQLPVAREYLDAAGIASVRVEGEEADDVMASLVRWAEPEADAIYLASSDKDLFQLVSEKTSLLTLSGAGELIDRAGVKSRTGVDPEQVVDWLAMTGDTVDNIQGIHGIGPKTATALLNEYGSLEAIRNRIGDVTPDKLREALRTGWDLLSRNVDLIRLRPNIDMTRTWDDLEAREPNHEKLLSLFETLEFKNMAREIREPELF